MYLAVLLHLGDPDGGLKHGVCARPYPETARMGNENIKHMHMASRTCEMITLCGYKY
jgi:hypothetical protein